jgi:hypothetical protein
VQKPKGGETTFKVVARLDGSDEKRMRTSSKIRSTVRNMRIYAQATFPEQGIRHLSVSWNIFIVLKPELLLHVPGGY